MECVWHRASLRAVCAALTCSAMDLQVVVWLFYCLLLPSGLLTGKLKEKQLHWCQHSGSQLVRARLRDALGVRQGVKTLHKFDRSRTGRHISTLRLYFRGVHRNSQPCVSHSGRALSLAQKCHCCACTSTSFSPRRWCGKHQFTLGNWTAACTAGFPERERKVSVSIARVKAAILSGLWKSLFAPPFHSQPSV